MKERIPRGGFELKPRHVGSYLAQIYWRTILLFNFTLKERACIARINETRRNPLRLSPEMKTIHSDIEEPSVSMTDKIIAGWFQLGRWEKTLLNAIEKKLHIVEEKLCENIVTERFRMVRLRNIRNLGLPFGKPFPLGRFGFDAINVNPINANPLIDMVPQEIGSYDTFVTNPSNNNRSDVERTTSAWQS
ncbi:unnamed protein product [Dovyalis caffra]|uniref:Ribosomal protein S3 n=1 Tax=Dovyalis caffra TaxID=77055 RepID=A0AAV1RR10_9ROSI|nr:unnamed protein product [Dovyalis caffra]